MRYLAVLLCSLLTSCLPATVTQLKTSVPAHQFSVDLNYQVAYRAVENFLDECVPSGFLLETTSVKGNLYSDINAADVTVQSNNMGDKSTILRVEIKGIAKQSEVMVYSAQIGIWKDYGRKIERNLRSAKQSCS